MDIIVPVIVFNSLFFLDPDIEDYVLDIPPEIEPEMELFRCYPDWSLERIENTNGFIDLSKMTDITVHEHDNFAKTILSLNRKKYPLRKIMLNDCDLDSIKLQKLTPLLVNFDWVTLNGNQKICSIGWKTFSTIVSKHGLKIKKLELKIAKNENKGGELRRGFRSTMEDIKDLALHAQTSEIDNDILEILAPALVKINEVHLGRNSITGYGWSALNKAWIEEDANLSKKLSTLNLSASEKSGKFHLVPTIGAMREIKMTPLLQKMSRKVTEYIQPSEMEELSHVILKMVHVNLSGQDKIGVGWETFTKIVYDTIQNKSITIRLRSLDITDCQLDQANIGWLKECFKKLDHKVDLIKN